MERIWTDFANSLWHDWKGHGQSEDRLMQTKWQQFFLERYQYIDIQQPSTAEGQRMIALRDRLIESSGSLARGESLKDEDINFYNKIMHKKSLFPEIVKQDEGLVLMYAGSILNWDDILADIVIDFAKTVIKGDPSRIRICDNENCRWIFYDETRNRRQRYCDDKLCGNLMKVRRFRAKKKEELKD
ncbi:MULTISPECIES: CGNR zinc finger domain-containing protein [unclassified Paenibacillus]|uniref:CGNR zinc finger domain-containing protein n=1 Tax=Paenibacillus provencensis TaxID=441151 RepID=A0ABW3PY59_9BACL|nr:MULTISPECIES: CGNR zinc finger domain-containing protein [unclassified Paenibacillus]MCM3128825.1 CGNR zinc finger domain-containing protein [Paenibacillus sp. MER 78]SFS49032.1 CGNR zinc finger domain-containing protein [Paenibacillus sp. 453mf]